MSKFATEAFIRELPGFHSILKAENREVTRQYLVNVLENLRLTDEETDSIYSWLDSEDNVFDVFASLYLIQLDISESLAEGYIGEDLVL